MGGIANAAGGDVGISVEGVELKGTLSFPTATNQLVIFAHGSGSSRFSSRNRQVAQYLQDLGLGTLLFDLLTEEEAVIDERTRQWRFDIALLSRRLTGAVDWVRRQRPLADLGLGLFGASTGAAAALITAAERPAPVNAVVSRGGRPDLAGEKLRVVQAPTLLIVGGRDAVVIDLNRRASRELLCENRIEIVAGATHLFEEPGALEQVARLAGDWFLRFGESEQLEG